MKIRRFFDWKVILLISVVIIMILAINPRPFANGIEVRNVGGDALGAGLREGDIVRAVNNIPVTSIQEFQNVIFDATKDIKSKTISVETSTKNLTYQVTNSIGFKLNNLTIKSVDKGVNLDVGSDLLRINNQKINSTNDFARIKREIIKEIKFVIETDRGPIAFLSPGSIDITVKNVEKSNIKEGLDLVGGTRVLLKPEQNLNENQISALIDILNNRLNIYGLSDIKIRSAKDLDGNIFILAELAGATKEEVESLIAKQGKFEAKIGNKTVFEGGKKDIPYVCRGDGSCSGINSCNPSNNGLVCNFEFAIRLSPEAAKKHALVTKDIQEDANGYLEQSLDLYLDDQLVDSLKISSSLKGQEATSIAISGPGFGSTQQEAYKNALTNMGKLQTVLITGSLPQKLNIIKIESISPVLGEGFTKNIFLTFGLAILGVSGVIFIRYRKLKIIFPMIITMVSEIIIILGFASAIKWNLDLVSIAGILAAVGTGVDDQIVIVDETLKGEGTELNWKNKLKRAFSIILAAYATTVAAMIPLWWAGAGLIRGLAVTTIVGITAGVFITRPAFASMIEKLLRE